MGLLKVYPDKCTGCLCCELACSCNNGEFNPNRVRIDVIENPATGLPIPVYCKQCKKPACKEVCPVEAIRRDELEGIVTIDEQICIGCLLCVEACPFGCMFVDMEKGKAIKCDLCRGNPKCAQYCIYDALKMEGNILTDSQ